MGKITSFLFSLLCASQLLAADALPEVVTALLKDLHNAQISPRQMEQVKEWNRRANEELKDVSKLDFYIVSKSVIYKNFLEIYKDNQTLRYKGSLHDARKYLENLTTLNGTNLTRFFIHSTYQELDNFLKSPVYANRKTRALNEQEMRKLNILSSLSAYIRSSGIESINTEMNDRAFDMAEEIFNYSQYFLFFTNRQNVDDPIGPVFAVQPDKKLEKTLDEILAPALEPQVELPTPVHDWDDDNEWTIKYYDPDYEKPKNLPKPVNDWDEVVEKAWTEPEDIQNIDPDDDWILQ